MIRSTMRSFASALGFAAIAVLVLAHCSGGRSTPDAGLQESVAVDSTLVPVEAIEVLERPPGTRETPRWIYGLEPLLEDKGNVVFIQNMTLDGKTRPDACLRSANETGRVEFLRHVKDGIIAAGQIVEDTAAPDIDMSAHVAYLEELKLSGFKTGETYWERYKDAGGDSGGIKLRCAVKISIPKASLEQQVRKATEANVKSAEVRNRLLAGQKSFLDQIAGQGPAPSDGLFGQ